VTRTTLFLRYMVVPPIKCGMMNAECGIPI
jgi:hypothetical protein